MRALALLLVAATLGFAIGRLTAPEEGGRGGERSVRLPAVPAPSPEPGVAQPEAPPPRSGSVAGAAAPTSGIALPTRPANEAEEESQHLEVDFTGFTAERTAWVALRSMKGTAEAASYDADEDGVAWVGLSPGTYEVWWFDGDGARLGTRASIEDGKVTVLRAVDHASPAPMPAGLGFLRLEVVATWGGGLGDEYVWIRDRDSAEMVRTDARGHACVILSPGRYVADIGEHKSDFAVEEGRMTLHRIQHEREGDLVLVSERTGRVWIARAEPAYGDSCWVFGGHEAVVPYVLEGEYEITVEGFASLGKATVHAGRTTRFRCELPPGGVSVRVMKPSAEQSWRAAVTIRRGIDGLYTQREVTADVNSDAADPEPVALPPGRYVVTASAADCEPASAEVDVADRMVDLDLALEYRR